MAAPIGPLQEGPDHCDAYRNAFKRGFPNAELLQCWPHISRKFQEGEYVSTTWEHFDEAMGDLQALHLARSPEMWDLLLSECGKRWDKWSDKKMDKFWNSNCIEPRADHQPHPDEVQRALSAQVHSDECVEEGWAKGKSKAVACPSARAPSGARLE